MVTTPLPTPLDLDAWFDLPEDELERHELVAGYVTMSPGESYENRRVGTRVMLAFHRVLGDDYLPVTDLDIVISEVPATVRRPDVVIAHGDAVRGAKRVRGRDVEVVVEIVSPGSVETDWLRKRSEYAAAGVPTYVVVDVRDTPRVAVFDRVEAGSYVDPTGDGRVGVVTVAGREVVLRVEELQA
ncbi:Uma2 family endonuclease [Mobilicoccus caccae]|uniref:Putative restriction endonuclease domain-containing protein n=1 Tax=Mobilicoccus caccae TaxID=1859295 RepID=A0ABQ6ILK7_9MICO|nr:Uma2 family endonuclease [Mobilicoccus caccae]GMA38621.1 hypothetical protein GCM10025883_06660 [Mobilicoccus caccae]